MGVHARAEKHEPMDLYCAVDIMGGGAVRLVQGDFDRRTEHGDPVGLALRYVRQGARFLHVVDLDAARGGEPVNRDTVLRIVEAAPVPVQVGGGLREPGDVARLLDAGAARVVVSTAAVEKPESVDELARRYPHRVVLGLDHRPASTGPASNGPASTDPASNGPASGLDGGDAVALRAVAVRGWEQAGGVSVEALLERFAAVPIGAVVVTSIANDGMMSGPDIGGLSEVLALCTHPVVASGGVRSAADLAALAAVSVAGRGGSLRRIAAVVVGRALASGSLGVQEGIAACERSG